MEPVSCEYEAAYVLVCELAARLEQGQHLRDKHGQALLDLGDVVRAILENRWPAPPARSRPAPRPAPRRVQPWPLWGEVGPELANRPAPMRPG